MIKSKSPKLLEFLESQGYSSLRMVNGVLCGLLPFAFTTGLMVDLREFGYELRYCYEHEADALAALLVWDGNDHPTGPWIKCKGRGVDLLNPELEDGKLIVSKATA